MDILIAVGGTGQHVALMVARAVALGAIDKPACFVVDADDQSGLPKKLNDFGKRQFEVLEFFPPFDKGAVGEKPFEGIFVDDKTRKEEQEIFEALFDQTSAKVKIKDGFYGNPSVGATLFAASTSSILKSLLDKVCAAAPDRIVVCGSFVGGTGAGIMHKLIEHPKLKEIQKHGIFFLPWFQPGASVPGDEYAAGSAATIATNMRHGLAYLFASTRGSLANAIVIGTPNQLSERLRPRELPKDGQDHPHFLHVVAARCMTRLPKMAVTDGADKHLVYTWGHDLDGEGESAMLQDDWREGGKESLRKRIVAAKVTANLLKALLEWEEHDQEVAGCAKGGSGLDMPGLQESMRTSASSVKQTVKKFLGKEIPSPDFVTSLIAAWAVGARDLDEAIVGIEGTASDLRLGPVTLPDTLKMTVKDKASQLDTLRKAWSEPVKATPTNQMPPDILAGMLRKKLFDWALKLA